MPEENEMVILKTEGSVVRVMCGLQLKYKKKVRILIQMLSLNVAID